MSTALSTPPAASPDPAPPPSRPTHRKRPRTMDSNLALVSKILGLGLVLALALWVTPVLLEQRMWLGLAATWIGTAALFATYATTRLVPLKYLLPGTLFLLAMIVWPIISTVQISFTNFGDGKRETKEQTIATIIGNSVQQVPGSTLYNVSIGTKGSAATGPYTWFLVNPADDKVLAGTKEGLKDEAGDVEVTNHFVTRADGFTLLTPREVNTNRAAITEDTIPTERGAIKLQGIRQAYNGVTSLKYDAAADAITNTDTGTVYKVGKVGDSEYFVDAEGQPAFSQSWKQNVGFGNYTRVLSDATIRRDFFRIFTWNVVFATLTVLLCFALGLFLASTLNDTRIKGQRIYRSLLLLPYAIPSVISLLVWTNFYNRDFGLINNALHLSVDWLNNPFWAKVAVLLTQLWMGFPYMFVVCTGALQSIPADLKEAASIDGASGLTAFRKITLPLLLVAVAPLLVASFAFNFNNYNAIYLLTKGGPFPADNPNAGGTDILISYTMRLAFGGSGAQLGFAAAISVLLFLITTVIAVIQFRATRALEDVN